MRFTRKAVVTGVIGIALAGAAFAAEQARYKTMTVALPDGSIQQIRYVGDTPPQISFVAHPAVDIFEAAFGPNSAFADMQRVSAAIQAQSEALLHQAATQSVAADGKGLTLTNAAGQPVGVMHYSYVSTSTDANGCTQTISYSSDGHSGAPKVTRTASDGCTAAKAGSTPAIAAMTAAEPAAVPTTVNAPKPVIKPDHTTII